MAAVDQSDLLHYPFLPEAQKILASRGIMVATLAKTDSGKRYLDEATERVIVAIDGKELYRGVEDDRVSDIITYVLARVLVSCTKDRRTVERFVRAESRRVYSYLKQELNKTIRSRVCSEFGITMTAGDLSVLQYVEMAANIREDKWRLINREVTRGRVAVTEDELEILLSEKIRKYLGSSLPLSVPQSLERDFAPWVDKLLLKMQARTLAEFGTIEESAYPPCIQALIQGAAAGVNLTHSGRFSLVAFLHTIGMGSAQIESIFARSPDYNPDMTMYQVEHILTNDYTPPSCITMLTHGICVQKNQLCERVAHPLAYYRDRKREIERDAQRKKKLEDMRAATKASKEAGKDAGASGVDARKDGADAGEGEGRL